MGEVPNGTQPLQIKYHALTGRNILNLIERFLKAGVMEDEIIDSATVGTPQGGVLSPYWRIKNLPPIQEAGLRSRRLDSSD